MADTVRIPWLRDQHNHASLYASFIGCPTLAGMNGEECLAVLRALDPERLSVVFGWHSALAPLRDADLDDLPPAVIVNLSMHGFALSGAALPMLADDQPDMVAHRGDAAWGERNLPQLLGFFSRTAGFTPGKLTILMERMEGLGLGSVDDMLVPGEEAFQVIRQSRWAGHVQCWATPRTFQTLSPASREALAGLKFFTDGALGSRTAALRGPFRDGGTGLLLYEDAELQRILGECRGFGKPVAIHAIGDRAIEQVLGVLERLDRDGVRFPLVRLEHVQFIDEIQARRARHLGLVLSMQPNFNSDSRDYTDRLDERWLAINNPFRMLIDRVGFTPGSDLIFGSDGMPHGVGYAMQWGLFPLYPGQRITIDELVAGYGPHPEGKGWSLVEIDQDQRRVTLLGSRGEH
jgi:predicted amidohydrolase YtcJ